MASVFKWLLRLVLIAIGLIVVCAVIFLLSYNATLRTAIQHEIRTQTGMDAQIGNFKLALASPTVRVQDIRIANPPAFGGAPALNISEIYIDYDRDALKKKVVHIKLLRINVTEFDIVKNQAGQTNLFAIVPLPPPRRPGTPAARFDLKKQTGYDFQGIDALNISVGKARFIDLANPQNNREQVIGIDNFVVPNIRTEKDLSGLLTFIYLRGNGFFDAVFGPKKKNPLQDYLDATGVTF